MARATDYARNAANRRFKKFRESQYVPEWLAGAGVWVMSVVVVLAIVVVFGIGLVRSATSDTAEDPAAQNPEPPVVTIEPESPEPTDPGGDGEGEEPDDIPTDYSSTELVSVLITDSTDRASVPEGARNVAIAGMHALVTGDWTNIPLSGEAPAHDDKYDLGQVDQETLTVADPNEYGSDIYTFTAQIRIGDSTVEAQLHVDFGTSSYRIYVDG